MIRKIRLIFSDHISDNCISTSTSKNNLSSAVKNDITTVRLHMLYSELHVHAHVKKFGGTGPSLGSVSMDRAEETDIGFQV